MPVDFALRIIVHKVRYGIGDETRSILQVLGRGRNHIESVLRPASVPGSQQDGNFPGSEGNAAEGRVFPGGRRKIGHRIIDRVWLRGRGSHAHKVVAGAELRDHLLEDTIQYLPGDCLDPVGVDVCVNKVVKCIVSHSQ